MSDLANLEALEATSSRLEKEKIVARLDDVELEIAMYALDPYKTYGVKRVAILKEDPVDVPLEQRMVAFECLMYGLQTRQLSGTAASEAIRTFLSWQPANYMKWFRRAILKDLDCGVGAKTFERVLPGLIPTFSIQLAENLKGPPMFPTWVDYKLDGIRAVAVVRRSVAVLHSRTGKEIPTVPHINAALENAGLRDFVLDGELLGSSFSNTQSVVSATVNSERSELTYNVFDAIPLAEWDARKSETDYNNRRKLAGEVIRSIGSPYIVMVDGQYVLNVTEYDAFQKKALDAGYEGIMVKDLGAPYQFKRTKHVRKVKPYETWDGTIVGWELGDPNGKWRHGFGAFKVVFQEGGEVTSVGGGFTDELRKEIYKNPDRYVGTTIEVKGQEMTEHGAVRFPVFVRFRDDK